MNIASDIPERHRITTGHLQSLCTKFLHIAANQRIILFTVNNWESQNTLSYRPRLAAKSSTRFIHFVTRQCESLSNNWKPLYVLHDESPYSLPVDHYIHLLMTNNLTSRQVITDYLAKIVFHRKNPSVSTTELHMASLFTFWESLHIAKNPWNPGSRAQSLLVCYELGWEAECGALPPCACHYCCQGTSH